MRENVHADASQYHAFESRAIEDLWFFGCDAKKVEQIYSSVNGKFPNHQYYVHS